MFFLVLFLLIEIKNYVGFFKHAIMVAVLTLVAIWLLYYGYYIHSIIPDT